MGKGGPLVFYNRTKPWGKDASSVALKHNISFFGYALRIGNYNPQNMRACVVDFKSSNYEWESQVDKAKEFHRKNDEEKNEAPNVRQANKYRNLVLDVTAGDIVLMPRPSDAVVYAGRIASRGFELVDNPPWTEDFLELLGTTDPKDTKFAAAEVCQCWFIDEWISIPFLSFPGWIRRSLFGRATCNRVPAIADNNPHSAVSKLMEQEWEGAPAWTTDVELVKHRLRTHLTPSTFEHLVVALLQITEPSLMWHHVGGSGDGGVDGLAFGQNGDATAILQCKWSFGGTPIETSKKKSAYIVPRQILAGLLYSDEPKLAEEWEFLGIDRIAELILLNAARLPMATTLRIGQPVDSE